MADQTQHDDESHTQDNVGTGAEISTENDVPANLNDGPATANLHEDGAPAVALESPYAAQERRSSTISPRKEDSSLHAATDAASTVAGAEAGAFLEREIYQHELAQSVADNAQLTHTAEVAEKALTVATTSTLRSELAAERSEHAAARQELDDLRWTRKADCDVI